MTKTGHYSDMQTNNDTWKSNGHKYIYNTTTPLFCRALSTNKPLMGIAVKTYLNTSDLIACGTYIVSLFIL